MVGETLLERNFEVVRLVGGTCFGYLDNSWRIVFGVPNTIASTYFAEARNIMILPFQRLVSRQGSAAGSNEWTLFGASGPKLVVQSSNGATSVWPEQDGHVRVSKERRK